MWEIDERLDGCTVWTRVGAGGVREWSVTTNWDDGTAVEPRMAGVLNREAAMLMYRDERASRVSDDA